MTWQFTILATPIVLACGISVVLFLSVLPVVVERRDDPVVVLYLWTTVAASVWTGFSALKLLHTDPATKLLFFRLLHLGAAALPPLLFLFVVALTDRHRWLEPRVVGAVFLVPVGFLVLLFVGPEGLVTGPPQVIEGDLTILRVPDGPGFVVFSLYNVGLVLATLALVAVETRRVGSAYLPQAVLIAVAVFTPMAFSLLTSLEVPPFVGDRINLVPTAAAISLACFGVLLYRYRLVDLPPLAYGTAMRYSPDALLVVDRDGRVVSTNDHGRRVLERHGGGPGTPLSVTTLGDDPDAMAGDVVETEQPNGEVVYHRAFVEPLTRAGRHLGWVIVLRDETAQQRQQRRLERKNQQLEFVTSMISHDLRSPLTVANGYLELLQDELDIDDLDRVAAAHDRMEEIIDVVLTLGREKHEVETVEPVAIGPVVEAAWDAVSTGDAALVLEADLRIMADGTLIKHVFENLLRNAVEHGGDGVTVRVGALPDGFYVADDGPGVPPEQRVELFADEYTRPTGQAGFGLRIVRVICEAHDWSIEATESHDGGARFEITGVEVAD